MVTTRPRIASFGPAFLLGIMIFCAFAIVAWVLFYFAAPTATNEDKRRENREAKLAAIHQDEQAKLYSPAKYTDKSKGVIQIPIDAAMDLVVNDYQSKQVAASQVKVENPYPAGLQSPNAAAVAARTEPNAPDVKKNPALPAGSAAPTPALQAPASAAPVSGTPAAPAPAMAAPAAAMAAPSAAPASSPEVKP